MNAYHNLAASYDRLTNDVDYGATVAFYWELLRREGLQPRTAVDLACGTGSVAWLLAEKGLAVTAVDMSRCSYLHITLQSSAHQASAPRGFRA